MLKNISSWLVEFAFSPFFLIWKLPSRIIWFCKWHNFKYFWNRAFELYLKMHSLMQILTTYAIVNSLVRICTLSVDGWLDWFVLFCNSITIYYGFKHAFLQEQITEMRRWNVTFQIMRHQVMSDKVNWQKEGF